MNKKILLYIHGGMTFNNKEDYMNYLREREISLENFDYWADDFLKNSMGEKYKLVKPRMPCKENAKYEEWKITFEKFTQYLDENSILIGTSLGGIFLAKYLSENKLQTKLKAVFLVAPPFDDSLSTEDLAGDFELKQDLKLIEENAENIFFYFSTDDPVVPVEHLRKYHELLPKASFKELDNKNGHFIISEFPELIADINLL